MNRRRKNNRGIPPGLSDFFPPGFDHEELSNRVNADLGDDLRPGELKDAIGRHLNPEHTAHFIQKIKERKRISKQDLLRKHERTRQNLKKINKCNPVVLERDLPLQFQDPDQHRYMKLGWSHLSVPLALCVQIFVRDLENGLTHRGRVLRGRLIVEPNFLGTRIYSILEDILGDAVMIGFAVDLSLSARNPQQLARQLYPMNSCVAVWEPFYKLCRYGDYAVMVSSPETDVSFIPKLATAADSHAEQADGFAAFGDYKRAVQFYTTALNDLFGQDLLAVFRGLSSSFDRLGQHNDALSAAVCFLAGSTGESEGKAYFMLAVSFQALGEHVAASACAREGKKCGLKKGDNKKLSNKGISLEVSSDKSAEQEITGALARWCCGALKLSGHRPRSKSELEAKALADRAIGVGNHEKAAEAFMDCLVLRETTPNVAHLLFSRANCRRHLNSSLSLATMSDAIASIVLNAACEEHHRLLGEALRNEGLIEEALAVVTAGLENVEEGHTLKQLRGVLRAAPVELVNRNFTVIQGVPGFYAFYMNDPDAGISYEGEEDFEVRYKRDQQDFLRNFPSDLQKLIRVAPTSDHCGDFFIRWGIPVGCSKELCRAYLFLCEQTARKYWMELELVKRNGFGSPSQKELTERLGLQGCPVEAVTAVTDWYRYQTSTLVRFFLDEFPGLMRDRHTDYFFSPFPAHSLCLRNGTNLSLGVVDLSELLWSDKTRGSESDPILWTGLFVDTVCFTKSLIIVQLLDMGAESWVILQVWFSSIWTQATLAKFREAVTLVISDPVSFEHNAQVRATLQAWLTADVSLMQAREGWMFTRSKTQGEMFPNYCRLIDGMDLCSYEVTGELPGMTHGSVPGDLRGSVTMFVRAPGTEAHKRFHFNCHFLQSIPRRDLFSAFGYAGEGESLVSVGSELLKSRIEKLKNAIACKGIEIEVKLAGNFDTNSLRDFLSEFPEKSLVNWNDTIDRISVNDFWALAKNCEPQTVHYLHSTRWAREVKLSNIHDTPGEAVADLYVKGLHHIFAQYTGPLYFWDHLGLKKSGPKESPWEGKLFVKLLGKPLAIPAVLPQVDGAKLWFREVMGRGQKTYHQHDLELYFPIYSCCENPVLYGQFKHM